MADDCEKLKEEVERLKRALENAMTGIIVMDANGVIRFVNQKWADMYGYSQSELLGASNKMLLSDEEYEEGMQPFIAEATEKGVALREFLHYRKDGTELPIWHRLMVLHDAKGESTGFVCAGMDLTDQKKHETLLTEKLDELERMNKLMIDRELKMAELKEELETLKKEK